MLERVADLDRGASMLVTFNGKSFDLPLLRTRWVLARIEAPREPPHLDLVHVARRLTSRAGSTAAWSRWSARFSASSGTTTSPRAR